ASLKARLDRQPPPAPSRPRRSLFRVLAWALLFGGSAFAITLLTTTGIPDSVRNVIWIQHRQSTPELPPGSRANELSATPDGIQSPSADSKSSGNGNPRDRTDPSGRSHSARGDHGAAEHASAAGTSGAAPSIAGATAPPSRSSGVLLVPKSLRGYATALAEALRGGGSPSIKAVDTTPEALLQLCADTLRKGAVAPTAA